MKKSMRILFGVLLSIALIINIVTPITAWASNNTETCIVCNDVGYLHIHTNDCFVCAYDGEVSVIRACPTCKSFRLKKCNAGCNNGTSNIYNNCKTCYGKGYYTYKGKNYPCYAPHNVKCIVCDGTGKVYCDDCLGSGKFFPNLNCSKSVCATSCNNQNHEHNINCYLRDYVQYDNTSIYCNKCNLYKKY